MPPVDQSTDQSPTINYGKTKIQITFDFVKWLLGIALAVGIAWGTLLTKKDADETYVKKELYQQDMEYNRRDHSEIKELLKEIRQHQRIERR